MKEMNETFNERYIRISFHRVVNVRLLEEDTNLWLCLLACWVMVLVLVVYSFLQLWQAFCVVSK